MQCCQFSIRYYYPEADPGLGLGSYGGADGIPNSPPANAQTGCTYNVELRATLMDVYAQAKKNKVAFADLLTQKMQTLEGQAKARTRRPQWPPTSALIVPLAAL